MVYKFTVKVFSVSGKLPRCWCCEVIRSRDVSEQRRWESSDRLLTTPTASSSLLIMHAPHYHRVLCALDETNSWELCASYHTCIPLCFQSQISGSGFCLTAAERILIAGMTPVKSSWMWAVCLKTTWQCCLLAEDINVYPDGSLMRLNVQDPGSFFDFLASGLFSLLYQGEKS